MHKLAQIWIVLSAVLCGGGWVLSAVHQLNRTGYAVLLLAGVGVVAWALPGNRRPRSTGGKAASMLARFRRPAPLIFLVLALLCLLGSLLHHPENGDSNSYRIPRVLHWLAAEQWHWIRTLDTRMNIAAPGYEWLTAPLILFTRTDRWLFLINTVSFCLLPGLVFSVFTRLGVRVRVAWWWMWLLPSGWCYIMQAGSVLNDSFSAVYGLAAVDFALRARRSGKPLDLYLSVLAAALMTGTKQTNLPLALPCLLAVLPLWRLAIRRPVLSCAVAVLGLLASAVPISLLNSHYTGTWTGIAHPVNSAAARWGENQELISPVWGVVGNVFCLSIQNLLPPVFPVAGRWNQLMRDFLETSPGAHFRGFESFGRLGNGISEATAGIGLGILLMLAVSWAAAWRGRSRRPPGNAAGKTDWLFWIRWSPVVSLLVFMAKVGVYQNARYAAAYYVLLLPALLTGAGQSRVVTRKWWRQLALLTMLFSALLLVVSRSRPLFPAVTLLKSLERHYPDSRVLARLWESFGARLAVQAQRTHFQKDLPPSEKVVGYATFTSGAEPGLWMPLGSRRVERVLPQDTARDLLSRGIRFVLVEDVALKDESLQDWMNRYGATLVSSLEFQKDPGAPHGRLFLVRLAEAPATSPPPGKPGAG